MKMFFVAIGFCSLFFGSAYPQQAAVPSQAGARILAPFKREIAGAQCYSGSGKYAGDVGFGFPDRSTRALAFTIGPLRDGYSPGQENNKPYAGPGKYTNIGISGKAEDGKTLAGFGVVIVNADEQTGTFRLNDGSASGSWNCGRKLQATK
jgi:hypothetical protein